MERIEVPIDDISATATEEETKTKRRRRRKATTTKTRKRGRRKTALKVSIPRGSRIAKVGRKYKILTKDELTTILSQKLPQILIDFVKGEMIRNPDNVKGRLSSIIKSLSRAGGISIGKTKVVADVKSIKKGFKQYILSGALDNASEDEKKVALMLLLGGKKSFFKPYGQFVRDILEGRYKISLGSYNIAPSEVLRVLSEKLKERLSKVRNVKEAKRIKAIRQGRRKQLAKQLANELGISNYILEDTSDDLISDELSMDLEDFIDEYEGTDNYIYEVADFVRGQGLPYDMLNAFLTGLIAVATLWTSSKLTEFTRDNIIARFMPNMDARISNTFTNIAIGFGLYNINQILRWARFQGELPPVVFTAFKIAGAIQIANGIWNFLTGRNILEITQQIDEIVSKAVSNIIGSKDEKQELSSTTSDEFRIIPAKESFADLEKRDVTSIVDLEKQRALSISERDKEIEDILAYL